MAKVSGLVLSGAGTFPSFEVLNFGYASQFRECVQTGQLLVRKMREETLPSSTKESCGATSFFSACSPASSRQLLDHGARVCGPLEWCGAVASLQRGLLQRGRQSSTGPMPGATGLLFPLVKGRLPIRSSRDVAGLGSFLSLVGRKGR